MPSLESPTVLDAVFTAFTADELMAARSHEKVLERAVDRKTLSDQQRLELSQAIARRAQEQEQDPSKAYNAQIKTELLMGKGNKNILTAFEKSIEDDPNWADTAADVIITYKRTLSTRGRGSKIQAGIPPNEGDVPPEILESLNQIMPGFSDLTQPLKGMNYYSIEQLLLMGKDSQESWDNFRKDFLEFAIPSGLDPVAFGNLAEAQWKAIEGTEDEEMFRKVQAWQLMVDLMAVKSGPYAQVARAAQMLYPTMSLDGATNVVLMGTGAQHVLQLREALAGHGEHVAKQLEEVSPTGIEVAALLHAVIRPIVVETNSGENTVFELGVASALDQLIGNERSFIDRDSAGKPLYQLTWNGSVVKGAYTEVKARVNTLPEAARQEITKRGLIRPSWREGAFAGRGKLGEKIYTESDMFIAETMKGPFAASVIQQLKDQGVDLADIKALWATGENGEQLDDKHELYRLRYQKVAGEYGYNRRRASQLRGRLAAPDQRNQALADLFGKTGADVEAQLRADVVNKLVENAIRQEKIDTKADDISVTPEEINRRRNDNPPSAAEIAAELESQIKQRIDVDARAHSKAAIALRKRGEEVNDENLKTEIDKVARRAGAEKIIGAAVITTYGQYIDIAYALSDVLGHSMLFDVRQDYDHLNELWNKMATTYGYDEKYKITFAHARKLMQSYIRTILAWKRKDIDPVLISLSGNAKEVTAAWQNPLNPEQAPIIPGITLVGGKRLSGLKKSEEMVEFSTGKLTGKELYESITTTIEAILYTKSGWRVTDSNQRDNANHLALLARTDPQKAREVATRYLEAYINGYNNRAPQEFPSSNLEAQAKLSALSDIKVEHLTRVNFKSLLAILGYEDMSLDDAEYQGVLGLSKLIEVRSSRHLVTGEIQKWFKYMSKYPELAVAEGKALSHIIEALNNALNPLFHNLVGGLPDQIGTLSADSPGEALAKAMVNVLFIGKRRNSEAWKYLEQVFEAVDESAGIIGYMSATEQRQNIMDIVMAVDEFSGKIISGARYKWLSGVKGEHGSQREYLTLDFKNSREENLAVETLRAAGYTVIYPKTSVFEDHDLENMLAHGEISEDMLPEEGLSEDELAEREFRLISRLKELGRWKQKKPYVTWGIQPIFYAEAELGVDGAFLDTEGQETGLEIYGHRGKERLMVILLTEVLMDKMKLTEQDVMELLVNLEMIKRGDESRIEQIWKEYREIKRRHMETIDAELDLKEAAV